jgi:WD repeat-containing protein 35
MYEGITAGSLDFDYAPFSILVCHEGISQRKWMNVTQEGKAAIDDLREGELVNGLKLSTEDFQPVTAFQVSLKGMRFVAQLTAELKADVDKFIYPPKDSGAPHAPVEISFDGDVFTIMGLNGYSKESDVTEPEDVSYVSSPYLPDCLRAETFGKPLKPMTSNTHRAHESATGASNIADELSEAIVLGNVVGMVGEWIPFGSNQIVALNERLGALDRCQGGLFTACVDDNPTDTQFNVPPGLTQVSILDYDFVQFINFEAEINFPEDGDIVQVENFGMHLNVDGTIMYGIKVEAILERQADDISLDHLSRVLVDVHQDSSKIIHDLLSAYQRKLLDMLFMDDAEARNKFNLIMASEIKPKMSADNYMDKGDYENELKQVLGDLHVCHDVSPDDLIIIGRDGLLVAGPSIRENEDLLVAYLSLLCREIFIRNYFVRTFVLDESLQKIRHLILMYQTDPTNVPTIRTLLNNASRDIILLKEVLEYLRESLEEMYIPEIRDDCKIARKLYKVLDVKQMHTDVMLRCTDLDKLSEGSHNQLLTLQQMSDVINTKQLEDVFKSVESNAKAMVDGVEATERSSASLEVMQNILVGSFAFELIDRLSGGTLNIVVPDWITLWLVDTLVALPLVFFILNMAFFVFVIWGNMRMAESSMESANGALTLRVKLNMEIDLDKFMEFKKGKNIKVEASDREDDAKLHKFMWTETPVMGPDKKRLPVWGDLPGKTCLPDIEITYNEFGFLLSALFQVDTKTTTFREEELVTNFKRILMAHGILMDESDFPVEFPGEDASGD